MKRFLFIVILQSHSLGQSFLLLTLALLQRKFLLCFRERASDARMARYTGIMTLPTQRFERPPPGWVVCS
jgi:hypothetical protein